MKKITSAYANKWLKSLEEDKEYWVNKEEASSTYVAAINEEPVIPNMIMLRLQQRLQKLMKRSQ